MLGPYIKKTLPGHDVTDAHHGTDDSRIFD